MNFAHRLRLVVIAAALVASVPAFALDKVRVASSLRGFWDTTLIQFGVQKGIFRDAGLDIDLIWTDGGSDSQQAVISGAMDIAYETGVLGVLSAWEKGAPIAVIAAAATGSTDYLWYVKKDSSIHKPEDFAGKRLAFTRPGSASHLLMQHVLDWKGIKGNLVSTGNAPATLTAVMSGQVDVGFMVPPFNNDLIQKGDIRVVLTGNDIPGVAQQTVRVHAANTAWLKDKPEVAKKFIAALKKTIDWAYSTDEALAMWGEMHKMNVDQARKARDSGYPKAMLDPSKIGGLDLTIKQALETKRLSKPLTPAQQAEFQSWLAKVGS